MHLLADTADQRHRLAEIHLRMPRRMRQRHEHLAPARHLPPHVILHHGVAAAIAVFVAQPLEDPLGRVPLLARRLPVGLQDRLDHPEQRAQLGLPRRLATHIARRRRIPAHLGHRLPAQPKHPGRLAPAAAIHQHKSTNRRVGLHHEHLPAAPNYQDRLPLDGFYSARSRITPPLQWPTFPPPCTPTTSPPPGMSQNDRIPL